MPQINIDFSEVDAPTGKQVDFVQSICRVLDLDKPVEYTRKAYSEFIDEYVEDYYYELSEGGDDYR